MCNQHTHLSLEVFSLLLLQHFQPSVSWMCCLFSTSYCYYYYCCLPSLCVFLVSSLHDHVWMQTKKTCLELLPRAWILSCCIFARSRMHTQSNRDWKKHPSNIHSLSSCDFKQNIKKFVVVVVVIHQIYCCCYGCYYTLLQHCTNHRDVG